MRPDLLRSWVQKYTARGRGRGTGRRGGDVRAGTPRDAPGPPAEQAIADKLLLARIRIALTIALTARQPRPVLVHPSDREAQYACDAYRQCLTPHGIEASMSRTCDCWDNVVAESFFATLELELIARHSWARRREAGQAIFRYTETWYKPRRRHSPLGYLSPVEFERRLAAQRKAPSTRCPKKTTGSHPPQNQNR